MAGPFRSNENATFVVPLPYSITTTGGTALVTFGYQTTPANLDVTVRDSTSSVLSFTVSSPPGTVYDLTITPSYLIFTVDASVLAGATAGTWAVLVASNATPTNFLSQSASIQWGASYETLCAGMGYNQALAVLAQAVRTSETTFDYKPLGASPKSRWWLKTSSGAWLGYFAVWADVIGASQVTPATTEDEIRSLGAWTTDNTGP